ncbi:hypothetical protein ABPG75_013293 [Micractinium tetrahymenae]
MVSPSCIAALVHVLRSSNSELVQAHAACTVGNLAFASPQAQAAAVSLGVPAALVRRLGSSSSEQFWQQAAWALGAIGLNSPQRSAAVAAAGGIRALGRCLRSNSQEGRGGGSTQGSADP